ncbi:MAG: hypothetical protein JWM11_7226 [Planctomycetaceae bacterium]|nr:hypothetical protein [Planctomycetaceae bacterium]
MDLVKSQRMDKTSLTITHLADQSDDLDYWRSQTPIARLQALELMRQVIYGYEHSTARLQRCLTVVDRISR